MELLYVYSLEFINWLQETYPQIEGFFIFISQLGSGEFYLAIVPLIYWTIDKRLGKILGFVIFTSVSINTIFKQAFRGPRPFWLEPSLGILKTAGYGMPSAHMQNSTALFLLIAAWVRKGWVWLLAILLIPLIGISRIYLGDHFFLDVLGGLVLGTLILAVTYSYRRYLAIPFAKRILGQKLLAVILLTLFFASVYIAVVLVIGAPDLSVSWAKYIPEAELESKREMARTFGAMLGFSAGIILESARIRFRSDGSINKRVARYLLGIFITIMIWQGLGRIFPENPLWLGIPLRFLRYTVVGIWVSYYAPAVFVRLRLADADPQSAISFKL